MTTHITAYSPFRPKLQLRIQSGATTCSEGFVICFLKDTLACLSSVAAAVPSGFKMFNTVNGMMGQTAMLACTAR